MDFTKSENQQSIEDLAQKIFRDQVDDDYHKSGAGSANGAMTLHDEASLSGDTLYDKQLWQLIAEAGLLGAGIGENWGGSAMDFLEITPILEAQGSVLCRLPLWNSLVAAQAIEKFGSNGQQARVLESFVVGSAHMTVALADYVRGELASLPVVTGDSASGNSCDVPYAEAAAAILVPVKEADGTTTLLLLNAADKGLGMEASTASNGEPHFILSLENVAVSADTVLGERGKGDEIVEWCLQRSYTALSAIQLGVVEEALTRTATYVSERHQFGKPLASFQAVSHRAADGYIDREALRSCMWQAAWRLSEGLDAGAESRSAKWWAGKAGHRIGHTGQHLHGGMGADVDYPIHRFFLWAKQIQYTLGGDNQQLAELGQLLANDDSIGAAL